MKFPETPPSFFEIFSKLSPESQTRIFYTRIKDDYRHWDELKHRAPPEGMSREEWWLSLKVGRLAGMKFIPLNDRKGQPFLQHRWSKCFVTGNCNGHWLAPG